MTTLTTAQIDDLMKLTLQEAGRGRMTDIASTLQHYTVKQYLMPGRLIFPAGDQIDRMVAVKDTGGARMVGVGEKDVVNIVDVAQIMSLPWRKMNIPWGYHTDSVAINAQPAKLFDYVKTQRAMAMLSGIKLMEEELWGSLSSSTDVKSIYGIPMWITQSDTTGFNGGNHPNAPSGGLGGLSRTTYSALKNYTFQFAAVSKADLFLKLRTGHRKTNWVSPVELPDFRTGSGRQMRWYTTESNIATLETLAEGQNDNLGADLGPFTGDDQTATGVRDGQNTFKGHVIVWVPQLDAAKDQTGGTTVNNPWYGIDHGTLHMYGLKNRWMVQTGPFRSYNQHENREVHLDSMFNVLCDNARRCLVGTTGA